MVAQKSCLDCHAGTKQGDTLGVMVYAVQKAGDEKAVHKRAVDKRAAK